MPCAWVSPNRRRLPAAEAVVADRDRDGHVDADHADLHLVLEPAGGAAVVGEDRGAVAVRVGVDQVQALVVAVDADDGQHRAEDLLGVDAHVRGDVVEQGRAEPEAVRGAVEVLLGVAGPAVDDQFGAGVHPGLHVAGDLVPVRPGDQRPHVAAAAAVTGAQGGHPLGDLADQLVGDRVHRDQRADRHAPLAGGAEAGVDRGVRGQVQVGVRAAPACGSSPRPGPAPACRARCRSSRRTARSGSTRRSEIALTVG